jgi:hypothetical protein
MKPETIKNVANLLAVAWMGAGAINLIAGMDADNDASRAALIASEFRASQAYDVVPQWQAYADERSNDRWRLLGVSAACLGMIAFTQSLGNRMANAVATPKESRLPQPPYMTNTTTASGRRTKRAGRR